MSAARDRYNEPMHAGYKQRSVCIEMRGSGFLLDSSGENKFHIVGWWIQSVDDTPLDSIYL